MVAIDFCDNDFDNAGEALVFDNVLYYIATDRKNSGNLRNFALSHFSKYFINNFDNREKVKSLLIQSDTTITRGIALASCTIILNLDSQEEIETWVEPLINLVDRIKYKPIKAKAAINALGFTKSQKAKYYLHDLFLEQASEGSEIVGPTLNALKIFEDEKVFKDVFICLSKNKEKFEDIYEVELMQKGFAKENMLVLDKISNNNDLKSKKAYLMAQRSLRHGYKSNDIEKTKILLNDSDESIRLEAVKTLRFMLPHNEEVELFSTLRESETSETVLNKILYYIGGDK